MAIEDNMARVPEGDDQFAQLRQIRKRPADERMCFQERDVPSDSLRGPPGRFGTLLGKETSAIPQTARGAFRDDYSWHSGSSVSPSLPQAFNQSRSSSPVRCRQVSWKAVQDAREIGRATGRTPVTNAQ